MARQTLLKSTLCLLMALVCNVMWAQTTFTFTRGEDMAATVTAPEGLTATMATNVDWLTSGAMSSNTGVLCPNKNTKDAAAETPITFTLTVSGLASGQEFTAASLTHKAVNSSGQFQGANSTTIRHCNLTLTAGGEQVAALTDQNIWVPEGSANYDKVITFDNAFTADAEGNLTLTLTIVKGTDNAGCFYGLTKIELYKAGPIVTFTNVQQDGTEFALYIDDNNQLDISNKSASELGAAAQFRATMKPNGKYTFYNESKELYMIWKGSSGGYNNNSGVLAEYNATYCDWQMTQANETAKGTFYFNGKRSNGTSDGTLVIMKETPSFDLYGNSKAWDAAYTNLYRIEAVAPIEYTLTDSKSGLQFTGTGASLEPMGDGVTLANKKLDGTKFTADITFTIPVSSAEVTNRVIIGSFNDFNNKYFADDTSVKANRNSSAPLPSNVNAENYLWAFYPTLEGSVFKFKIKNIGTGTYIKGEAEENDHSGDEVSLVAEAEATPFALTASNQLVNAKGYRLSNGSTSGTEIKYIGTYNTDHNGTKNKIVDANNYTLTLADGSTFVGSNGVHNLMGGSYTYTNGTWSDNGYSATVNVDFTSLPFPMSTVGAEDWTFIRCYMSGLETYFYTNGDNVKTKSSDSRNNNLYLPTNSVEAVNKYQWAIYYPTLIAGKFTFKIKNRATGKYVTGTGAGDATVADTGADFCWGTCMGDGSGFYLANNTNVFFAGNSSSQGEQKAILWNKSGTTHMGGNLSFTKEAYSITFGETGYTTLYTPSAVTIPDGVTAYTGHLNATNSSLFLNEVSGATIPAKTAVVLKGTASTTYVFSAADGDLDAIANNDLKGASEVIEVADVEGDVYTFSDNAFAKVTEGDIEGYTAYFELPKGSKTTITLNEVGSVEDFVNGDVYTFVTPRGWIGGDDENDKVIGTVKPGVTVNPAASSENSYFQWVVYKSNNGNYYLYNLGKEKFLALQSDNIISFVENPTSKALTFKSSSSAEYPIMISPDNKGTVSQNANAGLFYWDSGLSNPGDGGNTHKVTKVKTLTIEELATIADLVNAYDKRLYVRAEVEGLPDGNPNTHYGSVIATNASASFYRVLKKANTNIAYLDYDGLKETTISFGREYRGFEFQGFMLGEQELGKSFPLTEEQKASITAETPLVAKVKFNGTKDVTLFSDDDDFSYRIPAITTTGTGRIIAVSDYRHNLDDIGRDNHSTGTLRIDLVMRYSDNNGATWSEKQTIAEGTGNKAADGYDCAYGDAAIAAVGEKVLVMAAAGNVVFTGGSSTSHNRTVRLFSEDNGVNWTKEDISETLFIGDDATIKNGYSAFFGSGKLAVDTTFIGTPEKPRIYGAMLIRRSNGTSTSNYNNYAIYSDDFGLTWHILGSDDEAKQTPIASGDEPKMEILPNGQILLSVRRSGGRIFNVFTYGSNDGDEANGIGTWNGNVNFNNGGADCNGETFCVDATKPDGTKTKLLLQSQPKGSGRTNVSIWYKEISAAADATHTSADIAGNWTFGLQVSTQKSAYSAMTLQKDGKIGFFFEEAPCFGDDHTKGYCMVYIPLSIEEITGCSYYSANVNPTESTTVNVSLSDAQGNVYEFTKTSALNAIATTLTTDYPFITLGDNATLESDGESFTYTNTVTLPFKVSNESTTVWHNIYYPINTNEHNYPVYMSAIENNDVVKISYENAVYGNSSFNTQANSASISWAFYQEGTGLTFKLKNKLNGKYVKTTSEATGSNGGANVQYTENIAEAAAFVPSKEGHSSNYLGEYSLKVGDGFICVWTVSDGRVTYTTNKGHKGAWVKFVEAPDFEALFAEVNAVLNMFGDGLGQYSNITEANLTDVTAAKTAMEDAGSVKLNTLNEYKTYESKTEGGTLNLPKDGQFFRVAYDYGNAGRLYMQSTASSVKGLEFTEATGAASIWVFYDNALYSYTEGQCLRETGNDRGLQAVGGKTTATFSASGRAKGKYTLQCDSYVHANTSNGKYYTDHCSENNCAQHDLILEEVTSLPVVISNAQVNFNGATKCVSTLFTPVALEVPVGITAYIGANEDNYLAMEPIEAEEGAEKAIIPANTGVILMADAAKTYDFAISPEAGTAIEAEDNIIAGTVAKTIITPAANTTCYVLAKKDEKVGLYRASLNKNDGKGFLNNACKAYIPVTGGQNAPALVMRFGRGQGTTEIELPTANGQQPTAVYDLQGRRVLNPTKGMYIINGKKVVIR